MAKRNCYLCSCCLRRMHEAKGKKVIIIVDDARMFFGRSCFGRRKKGNDNKYNRNVRRKTTRTTTAFAYLLNILTPTSRSTRINRWERTQNAECATDDFGRVTLNILSQCRIALNRRVLPQRRLDFSFISVSVRVLFWHFSAPSLSSRDSISHSRVFWHVSRLRFNYCSVFSSTSATERKFGYSFGRRRSSCLGRRCRWHQ